MSAVLTSRRTRRGRGRERDRDTARAGARQESLFGAYAAGPVAAPTAPALPEPQAAPALPSAQVATEPADRPAVADAPGGTATATVAAPAMTGPTLDDAVTALWADLQSGSTASCPACGTAAMQPRHSAGAGVVGGRCGACDATLA
jgi:hypothetical protein